jgi:hypothetical protein
MFLEDIMFLRALFVASLGYFSALSLASEISEHRFQFEVQSWSRRCLAISESGALNCQIPKTLLPSTQVQTQIRFPKNPGEIQMESFEFKNDEGLHGVLRLYATYPHAQQKLPRYIQIQFEIIKPSRAFCVQSVRLKEPMEFPPTTCTSLDSISTGPRGSFFKQEGFNLIQVRDPTP